MAAIAATVPTTPQSTNWNTSEPRKQAESDGDVKQPDQGEQAPGREEPGADPDHQAALAINAVDLFLHAGRQEFDVFPS
jgi:hypothetical protein